MSSILKWKEFNESLPSYNPYSTKSPQKIKICPYCKSTDLIELGPSNYIRDKNGDYNRSIGYKCNNCNSVFDL